MITSSVSIVLSLFVLSKFLFIQFQGAQMDIETIESTLADMHCMHWCTIWVTGISGYLWYLIYPMIAISENTWSFDYFWYCRLVGLLKWRITEPSFTAFIGFPFAFVFTCTFMEWVTQHHEVHELDGYNHAMNFGRLRDMFEMCSRFSPINFLLCLNTHESSFKALASIFEGWSYLLPNYCKQKKKNS